MDRKLATQPNLFLIGVMRGGSTSLNLLLNQHPAIFMSHIKEPMFYKAEAMRRDLEKRGDAMDIVAPQLKTFIENRKHVHVSTYEALFESVKTERYIGEASHYIYYPKAAEVIHRDCPDAKIIISLRNPTERLYSEYLFYKRKGVMEKTFREFVYEGSRFDKEGNLLDMGSSKIIKGFYYDSLKEWITVFGQNQVKIILFEDFVQDYLKACQSIYSWLGIDSTFIPPPIHSQRGGVPKNKNLFNSVDKFKFSKITLKRMLPKIVRERLRAFWYQLFLKRDDMDGQTREFLKTVYREDIENLEKEFKLDLMAWK